MLKPLMLVTADPVIVSVAPTTRICIPPSPAEITETAWDRIETCCDKTEIWFERTLSALIRFDVSFDSAFETRSTPTETTLAAFEAAFAIDKALAALTETIDTAFETTESAW